MFRSGLYLRSESGLHAYQYQRSTLFFYNIILIFGEKKGNFVPRFSSLFSLHDWHQYSTAIRRCRLHITAYPKKYAHGYCFAVLCFVVVIHWLIFPYPSGLLHWHCGNLTIAPVPAKQPWWIWINTSCEFIMNDCITTALQSTTKSCAYFLGYTVTLWQMRYTFIKRPEERTWALIQYKDDILPV